MLIHEFIEELRLFNQMAHVCLARDGLPPILLTGIRGCTGPDGDPYVVLGESLLVAKTVSDLKKGRKS